MGTEMYTIDYDGEKVDLAIKKSLMGEPAIWVNNPTGQEIIMAFQAVGQLKQHLHDDKDK